MAGGLSARLEAQRAAAARVQTDPQNRVTLRVGGVEWGGWLGVEIDRGIEQCASSFAFATSAKYPGQTRPIRIPPGVACEVAIGDDRLITGYVDVVDLEDSPDRWTIQIAGRSKTGDLIDCSAFLSTSELRGLDLYAIAAAIAEPYGVTVVMVGDPGEPFPRFVVGPHGERCHEAIERACRMRGFVPTDDGDGHLVLTRVGQSRTTTRLEAPGNLLSCRAKYDASERFSDYEVRGQQAGVGASAYDTSMSEANGTTTDPAHGRFRYLLLHAESSADAASCLTRARWEAAIRAGKSISVDVEVQGWRQGNGDLWEPNTIVPVRDLRCALDCDLLIVSCQYTLDLKGPKTRMHLAPPAAYTPEPITVRSADGKGGTKTRAAGNGFVPWLTVGGDGSITATGNGGVRADIASDAEDEGEHEETGE